MTGDGGFLYALERRGYVTAGPYTPECTVEHPEAGEYMSTEEWISIFSGKWLGYGRVGLGCEMSSRGHQGCSSVFYLSVKPRIILDTCFH